MSNLLLSLAVILIVATPDVLAIPTSTEQKNDTESNSENNTTNEQINKTRGNKAIQNNIIQQTQSFPVEGGGILGEQSYVILESYIKACQLTIAHFAFRSPEESQYEHNQYLAEKANEVFKVNARNAIDQKIAKDLHKRYQEKLEQQRQKEIAAQEIAQCPKMRH